MKKKNEKIKKQRKKIRKRRRKTKTEGENGRVVNISYTPYCAKYTVIYRLIRLKWK